MIQCCKEILSLKVAPNTACSVHGRLGLSAFFGAVSQLWQIPVSELFLPSRTPKGYNANRYRRVQILLLI